MIKKIFKHIKSLRPPLMLSCFVAVLFATVAIFLVATEYGQNLHDAYAYIIYVCAALAVSLAVWSIVLFVRDYSPRKKLTEVIHKIEFIGKLYDNHSFRTITFAYGSLAMNMIFAISKVIAGYWFSSYWLISLAAYYLLLCVIRFLLLITSRKINTASDERVRLGLEWKSYRICGIIFMVMTVIMQGIVVLIMVEHNTFQYDGLLIYAVATYDFYCLAVAIIYMVKNRKKHTPIVVAIKSVSLATSLVSMLSLQTAMFATFGNPNDDVMQQWMNLATGSAVCILMLLFGLFMVIHAKKQIKELESN